MQNEIILTGKPKIIALVSLALIFFFLFLNSALVHFDKAANAGLGRGNSPHYQCTLGTIEVRGWGDRAVASVIVKDSSGTRTRFFTLEWNPGMKKWTCGFYSSGDNSGVHPEENGFEWMGRFFLRARLEGSSEYRSPEMIKG